MKIESQHVVSLTYDLYVDQDGTEINRFEEQGAAHACRLANGHTLVMIRGTKYVELDKNWKQVKETALTEDVFRVKMW